MQSVSRRTLLIGGAIILVAVASLYFIFGGSSGKKNQLPSGQHVDPFSHQTVSNPPGKAPDKYGVPANKPLYLGFDKLLDYGLGLNQLNGVQTAFYKYSQALSSPIKQISVDVDNIKATNNPDDHNSPFDVLFRVQFDEKDIYQTKVEYMGLDDVHLYLYSQDGNTLIFDSGPMNTPNAKPDYSSGSTE